jgi:hypothetical protein
MKATSMTPSVRAAIAICFASVVAIASSPAWSQSLIGDGLPASADPTSRYCRSDLVPYCQGFYAPAAPIQSDAHRR